MNKEDLINVTRDWSHRDDLEDQMDLFVSNVSQRLGERFGVMPAPLNNGADTNSLLTHHPRIYILGMQVEVSIYTKDADAAQAYESVFQEAIRNLNINYQDLDWSACCPPVMRPCRCED